MLKEIKLSIVIVNYESNKDTLDCISALMHSKVKFKYEVIVVDNSSKDKLGALLKRKFPNVKYIKSEKNVGYGAGNNLGVKNASGEYILFLNPDTRVNPDTLKVLSEFLDKNKKAAGLSPVLTDEKGVTFSQMGSKELTPLRAIFSLTFINRIFPNNPISKRYFLNGVPSEKEREADAIPGSAFMIRKSIFEKAGKFDENIFLYFEESDLGKRIKALGYKLYITPKTKVMHKWKVDKKNSYLQNIFNKSRFYYFKKHFGIFWALLVELFCRISVYDLLFILILSAGIFIRFYKLETIFNFDSETADNLLVMKNAVNNGKLPLIGPPTSHPWLYFAPLFYWFYIPILLLSKYQPLAHFVTGVFVNSLGIILYYLVIKRIWNKNIAILTSVFMAFSPYLLLFSQSARFYTYIFPLSAVILYLIYQAIKNRRYLFWLFVALGITLSFHYTPLALIPGILIILRKNIFKLQNIKSAILGFIIPLIPLIIYDAKNGFSMSTKLLMWIPYKILIFLNIINIPSKTYSFSDSFQSFLNFANLLFGFYNDHPLTTFIIFISVLVLLVFHLKNAEGNIKITAGLTLIYLILLVLHGNAPLHYYMTVVPFIFILISDFVLKIYKKSSMLIKLIFVSFLILFVYKNIYYQLGREIYTQNSSNYSQGYVPFNIMKIVSENIVQDSNGNYFSIKRIGINDQFPGDFAQNYQYLMWMAGNEPVMVGGMAITDNKSNFEYTIIENYDYSSLTKDSNMIFSVGSIEVYKKIYDQ